MVIVSLAYKELFVTIGMSVIDVIASSISRCKLICTEYVSHIITTAYIIWVTNAVNWHLGTRFGYTWFYSNMYSKINNNSFENKELNCLMFLFGGFQILILPSASIDCTITVTKTIIYANLHSIETRTRWQSQLDGINNSGIQKYVGSSGYGL